MGLAAKAFTLIRLALSGKGSPARAIYEASLSGRKPTPVDAKVIIAVVVFMPLLLLSFAVVDASPESARALSPLAGLRCMDYFQAMGPGCPKSYAIVETASMERGEWRETLRLNDSKIIRPSPAGFGPQGAGLRWRSVQALASGSANVAGSELQMNLLAQARAVALGPGAAPLKFRIATLGWRERARIGGIDPGAKPSEARADEQALAAAIRDEDRLALLACLIALSAFLAASAGAAAGPLPGKWRALFSEREALRLASEYFQLCSTLRNPRGSKGLQAEPPKALRAPGADPRCSRGLRARPPF